MTRIVLWAAFLVTVVYVVLQKGPEEIALALGLVAIGLWMWGCALYARSKGYSAVLGAVLGIPNILGLAVLAMLPDRSGENAATPSQGENPFQVSPPAAIAALSVPATPPERPRQPAEAPLQAEALFRLAPPRPKVPPDCVCCGNVARPAHYLTGKSRRMWVALVILLLAGLVALGVLGEGDLHVTSALLGLACYFALYYLVFYGIIVFPVLILSRKWVQQGGRFAELAGSLAAFAAFGLLILFIGYVVANKAGDLPGVAVGSGVVVLLAVAIERIGTVYAPLCPLCFTTAGNGVKVMDYAPLGNELVLSVSAPDIAKRLANVSRTAPRSAAVSGPSPPPAAPDDKNRRPCPKCGRMNLDWISKCPGCNQKLS